MSNESDASPDIDALHEPLSQLLRHAEAAGATAADAVGIYGRSASVTVRGAELEDVENAEGFDVGLRVLVGQRQASVSSSDLSPGTLRRLAERAVAMAKLAPEDPFAGLAPEDRLSGRRNADGLDLYDTHAPTPDELKARALEVEAAALGVSGVRQAEGASASYQWSAVRLMTSHGFDGGYRGSRHGLSVSAVAESGGSMERDYDYHSLRHFEDLRSPEAVGRLAGERAVRRLGSAPMESGSLPVLFDRRVSAALPSALIGAVTGSAVARGVSFLKDSRGEALFPRGVTIADEPLRVRGLASRPFDGEGVAVGRFPVIADGVLSGWLLNSAAARQLGLATTGHAARGLSGGPGISPSNIVLSAGELDRHALIREAGTGLLVREMFGPSLNATTGDYSVGVSGTAIRNGALAEPVSEVTIAGNLRDVFASMIAGSDTQWDREIAAPSLLVEGLTIAGR